LNQHFITKQLRIWTYYLIQSHPSLIFKCFRKKLNVTWIEQVRNWKEVSFHINSNYFKGLITHSWYLNNPQFLLFDYWPINTNLSSPQFLLFDYWPINSHLSSPQFLLFDYWPINTHLSFPQFLLFDYWPINTHLSSSHCSSLDFTYNRFS
jgi:hypothetical protein